MHTKVGFDSLFSVWLATPIYNRIGVRRSAMSVANNPVFRVTASKVVALAGDQLRYFWASVGHAFVLAAGA